MTDEDTRAAPKDTGTALVVRPIMPLGSIEDGKAQMDAFQRESAAVLTNADWQGPPGRQGSFVKKSGWRKLALRYGVSTSIVPGSRIVVHDADGNPVRAECVVRAVHTATGQYQEADGYCSVDEPRFNRESGRLKLENDLRGTATTRAKNRAIADLIAFGQVSAEEMDVEPAGSTFGAPASEQLSATFDRASLWLTRDDLVLATEYREALAQAQENVLTRPAAAAIVLLAVTLRKAGVRIERDEPPEEPATDAERDAARADADESGEYEPDPEVVDAVPVDDPGAPTDLPPAGDDVTKTTTQEEPDGPEQ